MLTVFVVEYQDFIYTIAHHIKNAYLYSAKMQNKQHCGVPILEKQTNKKITKQHDN